MSANSRVMCLVIVAGTAALAPQTVQAKAVFTGQVLNVTHAPYSADATCTTDARLSLAAAFADAQTGSGNTVFFPAGHYCIKTGGGSLAALGVNKTFPIVVDGAGRDRVTITEQVPGQDLLSVKTDGVTVQNITLDAQSCNCGQGHGFGSGANNTLLQNVRVLGGTTTARFPIYFAGHAQPGGYATGNKIINVILNDQICDDALSWSYQENGLIQNVQETGAHLSLFIDKTTLVDGYTFYPGPSQQATCPGRITGWGITAPSSDVTIKDFKTYAAGGFIRPEKSPTITNTNITIINEQIMTKGFGLEVQDVHGLTVDGGTWGPNGSIRFRPTRVADDVTIKNITSLPMVRFILSKASPASVGQTLGLHFVNDSFPGFTPMTGQTPYTFQNAYGGLVSFDVNGGTWSTPTGGSLFSGNKKGTNTTCVVTSLVGYGGPPSPC